MKNLSALIKKSKERKEQGVFVVEGTKMVAEAPAEWIKNVYMSETYGQAAEHREFIQGLQKECC